MVCIYLPPRVAINAFITRQSLRWPTLAEAELLPLPPKMARIRTPVYSPLLSAGGKRRRDGDLRPWQR